MTTNGSAVHQPRQHWLSRMQVINWGVFDGYHDIALTRTGTLLTGSSGAGKSSLLDALSVAFLSQRRRNFNASNDKSGGHAPQSSQRSVDKYIRGMVGDVQNPGERVRKKFLRPTGAAWSAIAVTYSGSTGSVITGLVLKWLQAGQESNASSLYAIINADVDIKDACDAWAVGGFSKSVLEKAGWQCRRKDEGWYLDTLYGAIGLTGASSALDLLGKAKSLKSVGGMEDFVREYMLDEPESLKELNTALEQINPLVQARDALSVARRKLERLRNIEEIHQNYVSESAQLATIHVLERQTVVAWMDQRRVAQIPPEIERLDTEIDRIGEETQELADRQSILDARRREVFSLLTSISKDLAPLQTALNSARVHTQDVSAARTTYDEVLWDLEFPPAETVEDFESLRVESLAAIGNITDQLTALQTHMIDVLAPAKSAAGDQLRAAAEELKRVEARGSTVPRDADRMRGEIAQALGLNHGQLLYVCELMDLRPDRSRWRKAVERVLRGAGLALLVPERHHRAALRYVNDHNMRGFLRIEKVTSDLPASEPPRNSLAGCPQLIDPGHECARTAAHLIAQQGDYTLVDSTEEFGHHRRAVTDQGLRKESEKRSIKDDRGDLSPSTYIFQGNIAEKIAALREELEEAQERFERAEKALTEIDAKVIGLRTKGALWEKLSQFDRFSKVDLVSAEAEEQALQRQLDALMADNPDLSALEAEAEKYKNDITLLGNRQARLELELEGHDARRTKLLNLQETLRPAAVGDHSRKAIEAYLPELSQTLDLLDPTPYVTELWRIISGDQQRLEVNVNRLRRDLETIIRNFDIDFPEAIPNDSSDLDEKVHDYVALWRRIKDREVAEAEEQMLLLITEQAPHAILRLYQLADDEAQRIQDQINRVNAGLVSVEFAPGTILKLCAEDKHLTAAMQFNEIARRVSERIPAVSNRDEKAIFDQYEDILELRNKLASEQSEDRRWKADALDVRNRFIFYCAEYDKDDLLTPKATYTNATAKSGGEQEKLMAFCLAGALSYNLADHDSGDSRPVFAQLMIDEAFSKSDPDFARQSLSAFRRFGFQLVIVATVTNTTVIQPYIDSVVMVSKNTDERASAQTVTVQRLTALRKEAAAATASQPAG
ncbi:ATP-binding protein [Mycobacteroides abscessus]|uniref:ATP-binding protein n=1 Tax=Mycobacteroides abscessus TaxID=36809 RepID=UPI0009416EB3|nr:ATP-binding protein [Mycobacteroides abscessus]